MALDPMLFKQFHKPGSQTAVPAPRPANPPPAKEMLTPEVEIHDPVDTGDKEPTVEARGHAAETMAEKENRANALAEAGYVQEAEDSLEEQIDSSDEELGPQEIPEAESKEVAVFEEPKVHQDAGPVFKDRLQQLDSLVQSELGISPYTVDVIRSHVKQIMMDLVTQPELDAILIDRDVHNVLAFIRYVKVDAAESRQVTKVKKETKKAKDSKFRTFDLDLTALGNAISKSQGDGGVPLSLEDLSKFK